MEERPPVIYTNVFTVTISPFDFTFDFGYKTPEQAREKSEDFVIVARIAMSPSHAKAMIPILERMVRTYERDIGYIPVPPEKE